MQHRSRARCSVSLVPLLLTVAAALFAPRPAYATGGYVVQWGYTWRDRTVPFLDPPSSAISDIIAVAGGQYHEIALHSDGTVIQWGPLGPAPAGIDHITAIAAGENFSLGLKDDGTVVIWGSSPQPVPGFTDIVAIGAGRLWFYGQKRDGTIIERGDLTSGGPDPFPQSDLPEFPVIVNGNYHQLKLKSDGTVIGSWIYNAIGTRDNFGQAIVPAGLSGVLGIAAGGWTSLAIVDPAVIPPSFTFSPPNYPASTLTLRQANVAGIPPTLLYHLVGAGGYTVDGQTTIPSLLGSGFILSVEVAGKTVTLHAVGGTYTSPDGVVYTKVQ